MPSPEVIGEAAHLPVAVNLLKSLLFTLVRGNLCLLSVDKMFPQGISNWPCAFPVPNDRRG